MKTDDFEIGERVQTIWYEEPILMGTVVNRDAYTVEVRLDHIPEEMKDYEDFRSGVVNFYPDQLRKI